MNETHDPEDEFDDEFDQMLQRSLEQKLKSIEERDSPDYDGVLGTPPPWVPEWAVLYFEGYRDRLLFDRGYKASDLLQWIELFREKYLDAEGPDFHCPATYPNGQNVDPHCFHDEIGFLARLKWCVDQGKKEGLECLGDKFAINVAASLETATNARYARAREAMEFCIREAQNIWHNQAQDEGVHRIGEMAKMLFDELEKKGLHRPVSEERVKRWLSDAIKKGELDIPPQARKPGRPKK